MKNLKNLIKEDSIFKALENRSFHPTLATVAQNQKRETSKSFSFLCSESRNRENNKVRSLLLKNMIDSFIVINSKKQSFTR
jgi:hypothetical protein